MTRPAASKPFWATVGMKFLPFADAATKELPLGRLLRLALFQVSVGMAVVLLNGTLNRVLVVELGVPVWIIALLIALPLVVAPFRALIGHKSDTHRSLLGWRRVPYIWLGTMLQFGGLAIMPFALLLMSRPEDFAIGVSASALAFLLTGAGMHVTQTAGLALATDLAPEKSRPRVVALLYVMLLAGMMLSALVIGSLLVDFSAMRLVEVIQGAAVLTMLLNIAALWKQEARNKAATAPDRHRPAFSDVWRAFISEGRTARLLIAIGCGAAAFSMQDALLEPYGGEILGLSVGATTGLTGIWALGTLAGFTLAGRMLSRDADPLRIAGLGGVAGIAAFMIVLFAGPLGSPGLLYTGAAAIGFGVGLFSVGTLIAAMALAREETAGLALGAWGAVQATAAGLGIALGGIIRDIFTSLALADALGSTLAVQTTGYGIVYCIEIGLLLCMLIVLGPLAGGRQGVTPGAPKQFGLSEFPT
ncbi:BCD family MFS transporter [Parasphingopyxis sp.]|uniref:BCD family MFS transporter n=1 Tax=Parasphingopyxis sp. TaxID=1920299 RepID=UPI002610457A|nr:BCD family MFS transporter [Parasphingopyxis sp.]